MAEKDTSWLPEDHSWRKTTRHVKGENASGNPFLLSPRPSVLYLES
jgi:hypothetical protein